MCTLVLAWQVFADAPVAVAANRDEGLDRPSAPPAVRDWAAPVLAPLDEEAGGTWIGYNAHGVFAGITNRWLPEPIEGERSRGRLVRDVLGRESAEDAARVVEHAVETDRYDGFNLVVADANAALYLEWDGHLAVRTLDPGVHVVANVGIDGAYTVPPHRQEAGERQAHNADRVREAVQPEPGEPVDAWIDRAADVIADHDYGVCVHEDRFGTRSSSLIVLGPAGREYRFAAGPPCRTPYGAVEGQV